MKDFNIYFADAIQAIEKETGNKITQAEIAKFLGVSQVAIMRRMARKSDLKVSELLALNEHYKCNILKTIGYRTPDAVEIVYYNDPEYSHLIRNSKVTSVWQDREITHDVWEKEEKDLRIITMPGNNMNGGNVPILDNDLLIIDTASTDILRSGVYAYKTAAGFFVNEIKQKADGTVVFSHWNENTKSTIYTLEQLHDLEFKVLGKVIKALALYRN